MLQESGLWRYAATLAATALPAAATAVALEGWACHVAQVRAQGFAYPVNPKANSCFI